MRIVWTDEALTEIEGIIGHIAVDDPTAALDIAARIFDAVEDILPDTPQIGRPGRVDGTRELVVHASYIVAYQVSEQTIEILTVRHAARRWPEAF